MNTVRVEPRGPDAVLHLGGVFQQLFRMSAQRAPVGKHRSLKLSPARERYLVSAARERYAVRTVSAETCAEKGPELPAIWSRGREPANRSALTHGNSLNLNLSVVNHPIAQDHTGIRDEIGRVSMAWLRPLAKSRAP